METKRLEDEKIRHQFCYRTEEGQHQHCPRGEDSWCKWQKGKAQREEQREQEKEQTKQEEQTELENEQRGGERADRAGEREGREGERERDRESIGEGESNGGENWDGEEGQREKVLPYVFFDELKPMFGSLSYEKLLEV